MHSIAICVSRSDKKRWEEPHTDLRQDSISQPQLTTQGIGKIFNVFDRLSQNLNSSILAQSPCILGGQRDQICFEAVRGFLLK